MKKVKIKKEVEYWEEICKKCGKHIKGTSESHCEYNFNRHKEACNGNKK